MKPEQREKKMSNVELSQTLERLHAQLAEHPELDAPTLQSLKVLLDEIQTACMNAEVERGVQENGPPESEPQSESINQRLQDVITDFEVRHPRLTATLSQIADRLSEIGI